MAYYRNLAGNFSQGSSEQNEAFISDRTRSLPVQRDVIIPPNANSLPVIDEPRLDGYDELFDPPITTDYECPICMNCLRDPLQTACGHRFCKNCIERHMR